MPGNASKYKTNEHNNITQHVNQVSINTTNGMEKRGITSSSL